MSVEAMAIALHHSRAKGTALIVLWGIANHDGDGGAWPSIATLAGYARVTERNVQKALDELERLGEIRRHRQSGGTARTPEHLRPNLYEFRLQCPPSCDRTKNHRTRGSYIVPELFTGVSVATPGVGSDRGGVSVATPEPSINPLQDSENSSRGNRAREDAAHAMPDQELYSRAIAAKCPMRRNQHHRYEASGYCADCGSLNPDIAAVRS
jgi:hypothetical protein